MAASAAAAEHGHWKAVSDFETLGVPVQKFVSTKTGITVCIAAVKGPLVHGFLALATEAHDDDGLPHTLEHMVFMGSDSYPYKGLLDLLANRCFAQGTNAWTDTDHTCYTLTTAGAEGFINLLPIYLDHVLFANCSEDAYVTEVHHVTGEGEDAGVVYCEMQARQNTDSDLTQLAMLRAMYPGKCGHKSETGGLMENLRDSTTHAKVAQYHKDFYRPENLVVSITGDVKPADVFASLVALEDKISSRGERPAFEKPWTSPVPPLEASVTSSLDFPTDDEAFGIVKMGWRGPPSTEPRAKTATELLWKYLTDTAVAPLEREMVQVEDPFCNTIGSSMIVNTDSVQCIVFNNVATAKLDAVKDKVFEILKGIADGTEPIDMDRIASLVHRQRLKRLSMVEDYPQYLFAFSCIDDCLYGNTPENLKQLLNFNEHLDWISSQEAQFWVDMVKDLLAKPCVTIIGRPSVALAEESAEAEKKRVAAQVKKIGQAGLAKLGKRLEEALAGNEVEPPAEVIQSVPVPDPAGIGFHSAVTFRNFLPPPLPASGARVSTSRIPFFAQFDHINSSFVTMTMCMDVGEIPTELLPYVELFMELILHSPIAHGEEIIPYEDVVAGLEADTLGSSTCFGFDGSRFRAGQFGQVAMISLKVEASKYQKGAQWLSDILFRVAFEAERVAVAAQIVLGDAAESQRDGSNVVRAMMKDIWFNKEDGKSIHCATNFMRQQQHLTQLLETMKSDVEEEEVLSKLADVRDYLVQQSNLRLHVSGNLSLIEGNPAAPFEKGFLPEEDAEEGQTIAPPVTRSSALRTKGSDNAIIGLGAVESAYLLQATPTLQAFDDPDVAPIMVAIEYLSALEGPLWRQVRGQGLAYSYFININLGEGLLYFGLYRSSNVAKAFEVSRDIVQSYASGSAPLDALAIEAAISSVVYEVVERVENPSSTAQESLRSYFQLTSPSYNYELLRDVQKVTKEDVQRVLDTYFLPLFGGAQTKTAVCCNAGKAEEVTKALSDLGVSLTKHEALDKLFV